MTNANSSDDLANAKFLSKTNFAKRIGRSGGYVTKLKDDGRLVFAEDGKTVDVEASLKKIAETETFANPGVTARHAKARDAKANGSNTNETAGETLSKTKLTELKATTLRYKNQEAALDRELASFDRFTHHAAVQELEAVGDLMRSGLERLVDNMAPVLAAAMDAEKKRQLLTQELIKLRMTFKHEFIKALRRLQFVGEYD